MTRRNTPLEVEQVEQLALIARLLPHHGESPSLISQADGITFRQFSRALFQQHRPISDIRRAAFIRSPRRHGRRQIFTDLREELTRAKGLAEVSIATRRTGLVVIPA